MLNDCFHTGDPDFLVGVVKFFLWSYITIGEHQSGQEWEDGHWNIQIMVQTLEKLLALNDCFHTGGPGLFFVVGS